MAELGGLLSEIFGKKRKKAIGAGGINLQKMLQGLSAPQGGTNTPTPQPDNPAPVSGPQSQLADLLAGVQSGMGHMNVLRTNSSTGPSGLDVYRDPNNPPITVPYHGGSLNYYAPSWLRTLGKAMRGGQI